jgi:hypothetical protein
VPIAFSHAALIPSDRDKGARFVTELAGGLHAPIPPERSSQPLRPQKLGTAVLGEHLSPPEQGLTANGGNWTATKWFIQNEGLDAEVFFNYDLDGGRAAFSEKDPDYNADVLIGLAAVLRDGPRPARTPENDPNFTTAGPQVADLKPIPNSAKSSASFARGGKLLILTRQGSPTVVSSSPLAAPEQSAPIGQFDGRISGVVCLDADGNRVVVDEANEPEANTYSPDAPHRIWLIDRAAGTRTQLRGPWGGKGAIAGDPEQSLSGDGRYLAVQQWVDTGWGRERRQQIYFLDLVTGNPGDWQ